jgi:hypothetical protein
MNPFPSEPYFAPAHERCRQITVNRFGKGADADGENFLHECISLLFSLQVIEFFCILLVQREPWGQEFISLKSILNADRFIPDHMIPFNDSAGVFTHQQLLTAQRKRPKEICALADTDYQEPVFNLFALDNRIAVNPYNRGIRGNFGVVS